MTDVPRLLESRRLRLGRWAGAATVVCALHAGGVALALMSWQEEDLDDAGGALTVEMAPLPAAVPVDSRDVAHGPEQEQAKLTHEAAKPVVEEVEKDIPRVEPSPAPEPEVALPKPQPEEKDKPKEQEEPKEAALQEQTPQQDADVPITSAPPRVDAQPAPPSSPGQAATFARAQARYARTLSRHLERYMRYPDAARSRRAEGVVAVSFTINREGQVIASRITKSSGAPALDEEVLAMLKRANPLPAPPDQIPGATIECDIPITFRMK